MPRLLGAETPLPTEFLLDLLVRDPAAFLEFSRTLLNLGEHIKVVENVLKGALLGKTI